MAAVKEGLRRSLSMQAVPVERFFNLLQLYQAAPANPPRAFRLLTLAAPQNHTSIPTRNECYAEMQKTRRSGF